jgi:hypothetical protein
MYSFIRLLLHPFSPWCKRWIVFRLLGVWFCITHTRKITFQLIVYSGPFWKSKIKKMDHVGMPFFHVSIYHTKQWAKKFSVVSCVVCYFQNRENIFCCDVTKTSILKAVDQTRQNYILTIYGPVAILCTNYCEYISNAHTKYFPKTNKKLLFLMFKDCVLREGETEYLHTCIGKTHGSLQSLTYIKLRTIFLKVGVRSNIVG